MPYKFHYVHCLRFNTDTELFLSSVTRSKGMHGKVVADVIVAMFLLLMITHTVRCNETSGNGIHMGNGSGGSGGGSGDVDSSSTTWNLTSIIPSVSLLGPTSTNKSPLNSPTYTGPTTSTPPVMSRFKLVLIVAGGIAGTLLLPILLLCCCCCWYYC